MGCIVEKVIFVHGLGGSAEKTWGNLPKLIWKDDELDIKHELIFYKFNTSLFRSPFSKRYLSVNDLAMSLDTVIENTVENNSQIILVCHSLGGLIARRYCLNLYRCGDLKRIKKLIMFATPHNGSGLTTVANFISFFHNQLNDLCRDSREIDDLNSEWERKFLSCSMPILNVIGGQDRVVSKSSAIQFWGNTNVEMIENEGHLSIVKPIDSESLSFTILKNFLLGKYRKVPRDKLTALIDGFLKCHQIPTDGIYFQGDTVTIKFRCNRVVVTDVDVECLIADFWGTMKTVIAQREVKCQ